MQKSKPEFVKASMTGSERGGLRSEKRVFVRALLGLGAASVVAMVGFLLSLHPPSRCVGREKVNNFSLKYSHFSSFDLIKENKNTGRKFDYLF